MFSKEGALHEDMRRISDKWHVTSQIGWKCQLNGGKAARDVQNWLDGRWTSKKRSTVETIRGMPRKEQSNSRVLAEISSLLEPHLSCGSASNFEAEPLFVVPRLISGFQANGRKNDVPHEKPVILGPRQNDKSAAPRPNAAVRPTVV